MKKNHLQTVPAEIDTLIIEVRGQKAILDADLARIYGIPTKFLNRAVKRNPGRFPPDFVFQLSAEEAADLRFHFGTSKSLRGGRRYLLRFAATQRVERFLEPAPCGKAGGR
jgi:hypothetical protein